MKIKRALIAWAVISFAVCGAHAGNASRHNIMVLIADDWHSSEEGAFCRVIATLNKGKLAKKGVKFTNIHVAAACSPTRALLLTGVDNLRNGFGSKAEAMNFHIGRFIEYPKKAGAYDNTFLIFPSDSWPEPTDPMAVMATLLRLNAKYESNTDELMRTQVTCSVIRQSWASAAAPSFTWYKVFSVEGGKRNNQLVHLFAHVIGMAPTLLELAGLPMHMGQCAGQPVEPMMGRRMLAALQGCAEQVRPTDQAIGYELNGSAALLKGTFKLLSGFPPMGDGSWLLNDISKDPGEVHDLQVTKPEVAQTLEQECENYVRNNGVQLSLTDYDYIKLDVLQHVILPRLKQALQTNELGLFALAGGHSGCTRDPVQPGLRVSGTDVERS